MKTPHLIVLALFASLFCALARETPGRTCRIVFPDRPADVPKSLHLFDGNTSQEVQLPNMNFSPLYKLAAGAIQLKLLTAKAEDPKAVPPDAPSVEIPAEYVDFYLLVSRDPKNKTAPLNLKAINLENGKFNPGQTLWINESDKIIKAELGGHILSLEPQSSKIADSPLSNQGVPTSGYYKAGFMYQIPGEGAFAPITEQNWWHDAASRHLGFMVNAGGKLPKIYFYRDFRNP
jgi:hypothetical protein